VDPELTELSKVIADIYDAAINPTLWQQALASICAYVGGYSGVLYWHDAATQRSEALHLFNEDPNYTRLYFEKYLPMNPMFPAATFIDEGIVVATEDIMPRSEFNETRFYKEWVQPQGMEDALSVNLEKGVTRTSLINIRTETVPDSDMRDRLTLVVPHLQRAVAIGRLFDQHEATEQALTSTLDHVEAAVFLVGADGAIAFVNAPAAKMLDEAVLVRKDGQALRAVAAEANRMLRDIFTSAANGDASVGVRGVAVPLTTSADEQWFAHILPLTSGRRQQAGQTAHAVAAVFIRNTAPNAPPPLEAIAKLYRLTAGEVRVLDAMIKINGVRAMADVLGISEGTVRTHLHNLFRKTGTRRQSDLVKLVAGL
jgi:DNA-binding CsgD family transcriptional regulator/PAS domain-containing protein